jgi:hypothetical protein
MLIIGSLVLSMGTLAHAKGITVITMKAPG